MSERVLRAPARGDVACEAPAVNDALAVRVHGGADEDVERGAVLAPHARLSIVQRLAAGEARQDVVDRRAIDVEVRDRAPDVFVPSVTEHLELGAVRPQDLA